MELYLHIEQLAKEHGIKNVQQLCELAGVSRGAMTELKKGRSKSISQKTAEKLCAVLHVTIDELYGTEQDIPTTVTVTPYERRLLECFRLATDDERETIFTVLKKYGLPYPQEETEQSRSASHVSKVG